MKIYRTDIEGVLILEPEVFGDARGYFFESFSRRRFEEAAGAVDFVQDNESKSCYGVIRGLHFQRGEAAQAKLVRVVSGTVLDVAVDIRRDSPTFGQWYGVELTQENQWQLWIAPGLAHGFVVTSEIAHFHYKCTDYYCSWDEGSYRWDDPTFKVAWPVENPVLSEKDKKAPYHE